MNEVTIYTDGGCSGNPGPGGWGVVVIFNGEARQLSGGEKNTTNNRMELTAAINALSIVKNTKEFSGIPVTLNIDSQYVKNGITVWIKNWKQNPRILPPNTLAVMVPDRKAYTPPARPGG